MASGRNEIQRHAIDAVAQTGGRRTIVKDMALMAAAIGAVHFGAGHEQRLVLGRAQRAVDKGIKARPAGAAVELGLGGEQRLGAAGAEKGAGAMLVIERRGEGTFGASWRSTS